MVEKQQKAILSHSWYYARSNGYEQVSVTKSLARLLPKADR